MSATELMLKTTLEGRVRRTLQSFFRRTNYILVEESLGANGLTPEQVAYTMDLLKQGLTVAEIMEHLREKGFFD